MSTNYIQQLMNPARGSYNARSSTPDPTAYTDPRDQRFEIDGSTLPAGRRGLTGMVVPRAGFSGESLGFNPSAPPRIIIDPHMPGGHVELDMATINREAASATFAAVQRGLDQAGVTSPIERRAIGSEAYYHGLAQRQAVQEPAAPPPSVPAPAPIATAPRHPAGLTSVPVAQQPAPAAVLAPTGDVELAFGIGGEEIVSTFSSAIRIPGQADGTGFLVLGVTDARPGRPFFPRSTQAFLAHIDGADRILELEATGIRFRHAGAELVIYQVNREIYPEG